MEIDLTDAEAQLRAHLHTLSAEAVIAFAVDEYHRRRLAEDEIARVAGMAESFLEYIRRYPLEPTGPRLVSVSGAAG